ncbi:MAG: response regulator transcription factor [Chitinophagaceae bacterium]|nr:response regulator transcription factor [Chitinophagaceae bacterium]
MKTLKSFTYKHSDTIRKLGIFLLIYFFIAFFYWVSIYVTSNDTYRDAWKETIINFFLKLVIIVPIYWIIFKYFSGFSLTRRILLHIVALPCYIFLWLNSYYYCLDLFHLTHIGWPYSFWYYYIHSLIYLVLFGVLHLHESYVALIRQKERNLLKEYLQHFPDYEIVSECKNGIDAIGAINVLKPDLIFLDIQMPGKTGFEVLEEIEFIPRIIFTTAFDKFAIQAFDVNAVDYLLKPYTMERFVRAMHKVFFLKLI